MRGRRTAKCIASALGLAISTVLRRAEKESWPHERRQGRGGGKEYLLSGLPLDVRAALVRAEAEPAKTEAHASQELDMAADMEAYAAAPAWARKQADKYLRILQGCKGLGGKALREWVAEWNAAHPDEKTSYPAVMAARSRASPRSRPWQYTEASSR